VLEFSEDPSIRIARHIRDVAKPSPFRKISRFAEEEIILSTGRFRTLPFKISRNPFCGLLFAEIESGGWRRIVGTGPSQTGKSLFLHVIPILFHLFERRETVIVGVPRMQIASQKWHRTIKPAILASRYRDLLPSEGKGSRDGDREMYSFANGSELVFMSGGGDDKARAHLDSRVLAITETDALDKSSEGSNEADKITQLEARLKSWGSAAITYMECTVGTKTGRTWREYTNGTESNIHIRCPHCHLWVLPEREHLVGWQEAHDEIEAIEKSHLVCPGCGAVWTEADRAAACNNPRLVHKRQSVDPNGNILGEIPRTTTLGFRWTCVHNLLVPISETGLTEFRKRFAKDEDLAERELCQFHWAIPSPETQPDVRELDAQSLATTRQIRTLDRSQIPPDTEKITVGVDIGGWRIHWTAIAWRPHATPHILDYDEIALPRTEQSIADAIEETLTMLRDTVWDKGWGGMQPSNVLIDAGYEQDTIVKFCKLRFPVYLPVIGFGGEYEFGRRSIRQTGTKVLPLAGAWEYELTLHEGGKTILEVNADKWKSWLHARLETPIGETGAMTVWGGDFHLRFFKQILAEKAILKPVPERGLILKWVKISRDNHWLDSTSMACIAGHIAGVRLIEDAGVAIANQEEKEAAGEEGSWATKGTGWDVAGGKPWKVK
jgi:phage terminase large subunit GpA-like protein